MTSAIDSSHPVVGWKKDRNSILLIFLLYLIQAIPSSLFTLTIPITLTEKGASFHDLMIICLSYIPFCFKCFLSPLLNTYYVKAFGRGKTYLVPAFYILGLIMLVVASKGEKIFERESIPFLSVISILSTLVLLFSDIVLDGWVVSFLSKENSAYGAVCMTIGGNIGSFLVFNLFLPLNSLEFCNEYIYSTPQKVPILPAQAYITALAVFILLVTLFINIFLVEKEPENKIAGSSVSEILKTMTIFVTNSSFRKIFLLFGTWNLIFGPIHNLFGMMIQKKGVSKEMMTHLNTPIPAILFFFSMWMGNFCKKYPVPRIMNGFWVFRLVAAYILYAVIIDFDIIPPVIKTPILLICIILGAITFNGIAIAMGGFASHVAQETFGGPIMSTFGAIGNLGRLTGDAFSLISLKYVSWDNLSILTLVGMVLYGAIFVKGIGSFENANFKELVEEKVKKE